MRYHNGVSVWRWFPLFACLSLLLHPSILLAPAVYYAVSNLTASWCQPPLSVRMYVSAAYATQEP